MGFDPPTVLWYSVRDCFLLGFGTLLWYSVVSSLNGNGTGGWPLIIIDKTNGVPPHTVRGAKLRLDSGDR